MHFVVLEATTAREPQSTQRRASAFGVVDGKDLAVAVGKRGSVAVGALSIRGPGIDRTYLSERYVEHPVGRVPTELGLREARAAVTVVARKVVEDAAGRPVVHGAAAYSQENHLHERTEDSERRLMEHDDDVAPATREVEERVDDLGRGSRVETWENASPHQAVYSHRWWVRRERGGKAG